MARMMIGTNSAWGRIQQSLAENGLSAASPGEVAACLAAQKLQLGEKLAEAQEKINAALEPVSQAVRVEKENIQRGSGARLPELEESIHQIEAHLELLRLDGSLFGRMRNLFRIRRQAKKLGRQARARDEIIARVNRLTGEQDKILAEKRAEIEAEVVSGYKELNSRVALLQGLLESKELAEASVEVELSGLLGHLPESAWVLTGVELSSGQVVRLPGMPSGLGKIDHLVMTPSGLFAVNFYQAGRGGQADDDPFEQVRRAATMCHDVLKLDFPEVTVRAVLALHRGPLPESRQNTYVKMLPFAELTGYINWFKDQSLSAARLEQIAAFLQKDSR